MRRLIGFTALALAVVCANSHSPSFAALAASGSLELQSPRDGALAAPLPDGQVLIVGGEDENLALRSAELFSPVTDTFTALPASGASELQVPRVDAVVAPLPDGQVLIAGGDKVDEPG